MRAFDTMIGWITIIVVAALVTGCTPQGKVPQPQPPMITPSVAEARTQLAGLAIAERRPVGIEAYSRAAFGPVWADVDANGCNQRDDVLLRDAVPSSTRVQRQGACPHDVLAGRWVDPYTGRMLVFDDLKDQSQARAIQIDHVVPLAEAWYSGAHQWNADRRLQFANDVGSLLAVDGPTNMAKGSSDPAGWRPKKPFQCDYALRWISVKHRWSLTVDTSEVKALRDMLGYCAETPLA